MNKTTKVAFLSLAGLVAASTASAGEFETAMTSGEAYTDFRFRVESVDSEQFADQANAATLRSTLGYTTDEYKGFQLTGEFQAVTEVAGGDYNDGVNGKTTRPLIADPASTAVNQLFLTYNGVQDTVFKVGRQAVNLDNQRFIGSEDFRQNDMTHDAAVVVNNSIEDTTILYGYVHNIHTTSGTKLSTATHLLNAAYDGFKAGKVSVYNYMLDVDAAPTFSTNTTGIRFVGETPVNEKVTGIYEAEYAYQSDFADNTEDYNADYYHIAAGAKAMGITAKVGYEVLTGDGTSSFRTPLGSNHEFNGWSDTLNTTNNSMTDGLEDLYIKGAYTIACECEKSFFNGMMIEGAYHMFEAENNSEKYGNELNLGVSKGFGENYRSSLQFASFDGDSGTYADQTKVWLTLGAKF